MKKDLSQYNTLDEIRFAFEQELHELAALNLKYDIGVTVFVSYEEHDRICRMVKEEFDSVGLVIQANDEAIYTPKYHAFYLKHYPKIRIDIKPVKS